MPRSLPSIRLTDPQDNDVAEYHPLSALAVVGLIVGLCSPLALLDRWLLGVPVLGILLCLGARRRIQRKMPNAVGRTAATLGLAISGVFLAAAPTHWYLYRYEINQEARQFADAWIRFLCENQPHKAHQLSVIYPQWRRPLDKHLWDAYRGDFAMREAFDAFAAKPEIRTLLALGPRSQVRFFQVADHQYDVDNKTTGVELWYAVTYDDAGERKSFLLAVQLMRAREPTGAVWQVFNVKGGVRPEGW